MRAAPAASRLLPRRRMRVAAAAAAVLALLVVGGALVYWRDAPPADEPQALDLPAPSQAQPSLGPATSTTASGPASSSSSSAATTTEEPDGTVDPENPGDPDNPVTTTTTRRPADPPGPPDPPDPPDPPGDTERPAFLRESADTQSTSVPPCPSAAGVTAIITDNVGVTSATLSWSGDGGSGSVAMSGNGDTWTATMGPFDTPGGGVDWTITATDAAGNASSGKGGRISIVDCARENS